jgi:hypothetical protein
MPRIGFGIGIPQYKRVIVVVGGGPGGDLLLETGGAILLETGGSILLEV